MPGASVGCKHAGGAGGGGEGGAAVLDFDDHIATGLDAEQLAQRFGKRGLAFAGEVEFDHGLPFQQWHYLDKIGKSNGTGERASRKWRFGLGEGQSHQKYQVSC